MYISEEKFREKGKKFFFSLLRSFVEQLQRKHPCIYTDVKYFKDDGKGRDRLRCIYIYISFTRGEIVWNEPLSPSFSLFIVIFIGADKTAGLIRIPLDVWRS